ncbi:MAG: cytochrome c maturation protein CcmE [Gammaproteobacteria bacterium]|nr:cytochrome c maturation protein CcmE [Gammaproteobacteria bacterium]
MRIPRFLHRFSSPRIYYGIAGWLSQWTLAVALGLMVVGLYIGLVLAPTHSEQGESYRIIFIHVPAASNSMMVYVVMAVASLIFLVWRIKLADVVAAASAPIGASFTFLALVTGSIWGKPTWGTWWQWDARLTSELILLFLYLGYMALRAAIENRQNAGRAAAVLALVGVINIPIIHYSVQWWNTLHQGATISKFSQPSIQGTMLAALLLMMAMFVFFYATALLVRGRCMVLQNEVRASWVREPPVTRPQYVAWTIPLIAIIFTAWLHLSSEREAVYSPGELAQVSAVEHEAITVQGVVRDVEDHGAIKRFRLAVDDAAVDIRFPGNLPAQFRAGWGARVTGTYAAETGRIEARSVAALNVRDHSSYVIIAYLIALVTLLINALAPYRCLATSKAVIARRHRREELDR